MYLDRERYCAKHLAAEIESAQATLSGLLGGDEVGATTAVIITKDEFHALRMAIYPALERSYTNGTQAVGEVLENIIERMDNA